MSETRGEGEYNPAAYSRGGVEHTEKLDKEYESDSSGLPERGHIILLEITTDQGIKGIPYPFMGMDIYDDRFVIRFRASLEFEGQELDGKFKATVYGENLGEIRRQICKGIRRTLYPSRGKTEGKAFVERIELRTWEPA